jgi:peptide/nickel transport system substrate-binding protein
LLSVLPVAARTRPHYGGVLRIETEGGAWQANGVARALVLEGLMRRDAHGALASALAVGWDHDNSMHRWEFRLRAGVHFQDGNPLTASAAAQSLAESCRTQCPWASVRAVGAALVFLGDAPMPNLPDLLAEDAYRIAETGVNAGAPVGTGPFQFSSAAGGVLLLTANNDCWSGRPFADAIEVHEHRAIRDQWLDLSVGRADLVEVPAEQTHQAQQQHLNLLTQPAASLLVLQLAEAGSMSNPALRNAVAQAVDRAALSGVIYQKQGESTASLLPAALSGYSFLFSTERNLPRAIEIRGGLNPSQITLTAENQGSLLLAAQRLALNLREAGLQAQAVMGGVGVHSDGVLRKIPFEGGWPPAALESMERALGGAAPVEWKETADVYRAEHDFLAMHTVIPLLYLPRSWAVSGSVRGLRLGVDGRPLLADAWLEAAP